MRLKFVSLLMLMQEVTDACYVYNKITNYEEPIQIPYNVISTGGK